MMRRVLTFAIALASTAAPLAAQHGFVLSQQRENAARARGDSLPDGRPMIIIVDSTEPPVASKPAQPPLRVLFLGNSLTYVNDVPAMFRGIAAAGLHRRIVTGMLAAPSATLSVLAQGTFASKIIASQPWDYIVVQSKPVLTLKQGDPPVKDIVSALNAVDTAEMYGTSRLFNKEAQVHHSKFVFYAASQGAQEDKLIRWAIDSMHTRIARELGGSVAPVGEVVYRVGKEHPTLWGRLYERDGGHPSAMGAYLAALVIYNAMMHQSPVGLPHDMAEGVNDSTAAILQQAAVNWHTFHP